MDWKKLNNNGKGNNRWCQEREFPKSSSWAFSLNLPENG